MGNVDHSSTGSEVLHSGEIAAMSSKFAEGYARVREVTDSDSACPAWAKAMYMAGAAAVRGQMDLLNREIVRSRDLGLKLSDARGAALAVLISRGEGVYKKFTAAVNTAFESEITISDEEVPEYEIDRQGALDYFTSYFGFVPDYIELMADEAPRALEGYVLMR